jgi:hypothetical protein
MNFINDLVKIFGTRKQKINAYKFDNEKLADEIRYLSSLLGGSDPDVVQFNIDRIQSIEHLIYKNNEKIGSMS